MATDTMENLGTRKPTGRVEKWWLTANLMFDDLANGVVLYGNWFGLEALGLEEGKFGHKAGIWRIDFLERVAEYEECYVQLGAPQSLDALLAKLQK